MKLFLTSSPCCPYPQKDGSVPYGYTRENGFLEELAKGWEPGCQCLMICSDPDDFARNDRMKEEFQGFFEISQIPVASLIMCDRRNHKELRHFLEESRIVILAGGHVPTQNRFFAEIGLKDQISGFDGTVMGISAGTMNCAHIVYAQPELSGESKDPGYQRFINGLGLTELQILPHYQEVKNRLLDGRRLYEDITFEDSYGHTFYALVDGSYVLVQDGHLVLRGEGYRIRDGAMEMICEKDSQLEL